VKVQLTVNGKGFVVHKTPHARGRRHDYNIFKTSRPKLPPEVNLNLDLGYDGAQKDYQELNTAISHKRRRGQVRANREAEEKKPRAGEGGSGG